MDIAILYQDIYLRLLFYSLFFYIGTFLIYLKKAKQKFLDFERNLYGEIAQEYSEREYSSTIITQIFQKTE